MNKFLGACLLIAGCSIGAGMLGLPSATGASGFLPSLCFFFLAWLYMLLTGLVLTEVTASYPKGYSFISMAENTFGKWGAALTWILFSLLFYTIQVAYFIGGGIFVIDFFDLAASVNLTLPVASFMLGLLFFIAITRGFQLVDSLNRYFMVGLLLCYLLLIFAGLPHIELSRLERRDWGGAFLSLPLLIVCFGFHNLVPSLYSYLDGDKKKLQKAILVGSLVPLFIYLAWEVVILGVVPFSFKEEWEEVYQKGEMVTQILQKYSGIDEVVACGRAFTFFAIATSFLPVAFSFFDFLKDALKLEPTKKNRALLALLVLLPPLICANTKPDSFLAALEYAGGCVAVLLFGLLPLLMAIKKQKTSTFEIAKPRLLGVLFVATCAILAITLLHRLGII